MNKKEAIKTYGKERCQEMHLFLDILNSLYAFPYSESTLYYFLGSLELFITEDLKACLKSLEDRESTFPLKFNEIKNTCKDARGIRRRFEKMNEQKDQVENTGVPMPDEVKDMIDKLKDQFTSNDPTSREG